jgi:Uma2 family endonuclease
VASWKRRATRELVVLQAEAQTVIQTREATVEDLHRSGGDTKAELVEGRIVHMSPTGARPGRAAHKIAASLDAHEELHGGGLAFGDNVGFIVNLPDRRSFSPDAAWYVGTVPEDSLEFVNGAPTFAAEVRSKEDYGPAAEAAIALKRAEYFEAGTLVVWDVDLRSPDVVRVYRAGAPKAPEVYRRGELAEAEPAVTGWRFPVDKLFA